MNRVGLAFRRQARAIIEAASSNLLEQLEELLRQATPEPFPPQRESGNGPGALLFRASAAAQFLGVSRRRFFELKHHPSFPTPVPLPGIDTGTRYYRREDLEEWVASLQPAEGEGARS